MQTQSMSRRFGVEIEFLATVTPDHVVAALQAAGISVQNSCYTHATTSYWKVVPDGSCGYELVSPILEGEAGLEELNRAATALNSAGVKVDRRCGFHVHFDASRMSLKAVRNLFKLWLKFEDVLDTFQPESRRGNNNDYCRSNLEAECRDATTHRATCDQAFRKLDACRSMQDLGNLYPTRYRKLNVQSFFRHRTLEVRQHAGTTCPQKITSWVRLMARMFDAAETTSVVRNRPEDTGLGKSRLKWFFQAVHARGLTRFYTDRATRLAA